MMVRVRFCLKLQKSPVVMLQMSEFVMNLPYSSVMFLFCNYKKKVVGLERGPFSLVSTTEELLDRKVAAPV
jgi:hypothetical protein